MNKYTEIKVQTAKDLMKEGYKWVTKSIQGTIWAYDELNTSKAKWLNCTPIFEHIHGDEIISLESIVQSPILSEEERRYLSAVIRPFRNDVKYIEKRLAGSGRCYILIKCDDVCDDFSLPAFSELEMYNGMKPYDKYTPEELAL